MRHAAIAALVTGALLLPAPAQATGTVVWENRFARITETYTERVTTNGYHLPVAVWKITSKLPHGQWVKVRASFMIQPYDDPTDTYPPGAPYPMQIHASVSKGERHADPWSYRGDAASTYGWVGSARRAPGLEN